MDPDRAPIIDYMLATLYKVYLLLDSERWADAFLLVYQNLLVINDFNEFVLYIRHSSLLVYILQRMYLLEKAQALIEFVRDVVEETNNYREALALYEHIGKMYQEKKQYQIAKLAFRKMLQIAWFENDTTAEIKAYQ